MIIFRCLHQNITSRRNGQMLPDDLNLDPEIMYTDIGAIDFIITYDDKTREKKQFFVVGDDFGELFKTIKTLVPATEDVPVVLMTAEDFEE